MNQYITKLINSAETNSPEGMNEGFNEFLNERVQTKLETSRQELKKTFFNLPEETAQFSLSLTEGLNYILESLEILPVTFLPTLIAEASVKFGVAKETITAVLTEAVSTEDDLDESVDIEPFGVLFLQSLNSIITENRSAVLQFANKSARKIEVNEAQNLAEVYMSLNSARRKTMVDTLVESKESFENVLEFSESVLVEDSSSEIHGLLSKYGYHVDHFASKKDKNHKVFKHQNTGEVIKIGALDTVSAVKSHLAGKEPLVKR